MDPCGMPVDIGALEEVTLSMWTDCFLLVKYEVNHLSVALVILSEVNLSIIRRWFKVSKALQKSLKVAKVSFTLLRFKPTSSII